MNTAGIRRAVQDVAGRKGGDAKHVVAVRNATRAVLASGRGVRRVRMHVLGVRPVRATKRR